MFYTRLAPGRSLPPALFACFCPRFEIVVALSCWLKRLLAHVDISVTLLLRLWAIDDDRLTSHTNPEQIRACGRSLDMT